MALDKSRGSAILSLGHEGPREITGSSSWLFYLASTRIEMKTLMFRHKEPQLLANVGLAWCAIPTPRVGRYLGSVSISERPGTNSEGQSMGATTM